jgi:hypothetical protein
MVWGNCDAACDNYKFIESFQTTECSATTRSAAISSYIEETSSSRNATNT